MWKQTNGKQQQQKQKANEADSTKDHDVSVTLLSRYLPYNNNNDNDIYNDASAFYTIIAAK